MGIIRRKNQDGSSRYYVEKVVDGKTYLWPDASRGDDGPWRYRYKAQRRLAEVEEAIARGTFHRDFGERSVPTVRDAAKGWLASGGHRKPWTPETKKGYEFCVTRINKRLGDRRLDEITRLVLEGYRRKRQEDDGVSGTTVNRELSALSGIFEHAIRGGHVDANPTRQVDRASERRNAWRYPDPAAIEKEFLPACKRSRSPHLYAIALCMWDAGLRTSEALNLRCDNLRFDLLPDSDDRPRGAIVLPRNKSDRPRLIPMTPRLRRTLLAKYRQADGGWVLPNPQTGKPYTKIWKQLQNARKRTKMGHFRPHDLRHGCCSRLAELGYSDQQLREWMGWTDTQMASRYAHLRADAIAAGADALARQAEALQDAELHEFPDESERKSERG